VPKPATAGLSGRFTFSVEPAWHLSVRLNDQEVGGTFFDGTPEGRQAAEASGERWAGRGADARST